MRRIFAGTAVNEWKPQPLDMDRVYAEAKKIEHNPQQDICILLEESEYYEVVIYNECVQSSFGRYIIAPGYVWSLEQEMHFGRLLWDENVTFDRKKFDQIHKKFAKSHPEWFLKSYINMPLRLIEHIYYCMNPGSVKELLYKAGLDELAARLIGIEDYNLIGSSPSDIFSGLSMRTLRAINHSYGVFLIESEQKRQKILALQSKYAWMFEKRWNESMCRYMCRLLQANLKTDEVAKKFRSEYKSLERIWTNSQYNDYMNRVCQREELLKRLEPELLAELTAEMVSEVYRMLIIDGELWNNRIALSNKERNIEFEFSDEKYLIFYPKTIEDFVREAIAQKNCVLDYCHSYVKNETDILFLRKKDSPYESFVTIEIMDEELVQAREKCNVKASEEVLEWVENRIKNYRENKV